MPTQEKKPIPADAFQFTGQPMEGWEVQGFPVTSEKMTYEALREVPGAPHQIIREGDWCVGGEWMAADEFAQTYEIPVSAEGKK